MADVLAGVAGVLKNTKVRRRALIVIANALNNLALPLISPLFSFLVIRFASVELWGEFVRVLIVAQLAAHVAGWGNKDYLLREFSLNPARIPQSWQTSLITRLALFLAFPVIVGLMGVPAQRVGLLILCSLGLVLDQAYDVVVLYKRDFAFALAVELSGLLLLALPVAWLGERLSLDLLLAVFGLSNLAKAGIFGLRFRQLAAPGWQGHFDLAHLRLAFPFFLLGFSGLMQSKIDLYCVSYFLAEKEIGQYQVFTNLMIYGQSVSAFILTPFVKSLYRLSYGASLRISAKFFAAGLVVLGFFLPVTHLALTYLYHLELSPYFLLLGGLFIWPIYFYLPIIYALFKANQQSAVIAVNFVGVSVNLLLNLILLPRLGLLGAVMASAAAQWLMGLVYLIRGQALKESEGVTDALAVSELPPGH